jgi:hypothetical protein
VRAPVSNVLSCVQHSRQHKGSTVLQELIKTEPPTGSLARLCLCVLTNYRSAAMVSANAAASCPASHSTTRPSHPAVEKSSPLPPDTGRSSTTALACAPTPPTPPGRYPCRCNAARAEYD